MQLDKVYQAMIEFYSGDPKRIQHFVKVHSFAALIGRQEGLDERTQFILETTAYVHDIGIKPAMEKYGSGAGPYQEKEGEICSRELLEKLGLEKAVVDRVSYIVGHHHTYTDIDGLDYQILVEADFLVNLFEGNQSREAMQSAYETIFKTECGRKIMRVMFAL